MSGRGAGGVRRMGWGCPRIGGVWIFYYIYIFFFAPCCHIIRPTHQRCGATVTFTGSSVLWSSQIRWINPSTSIRASASPCRQSQSRADRGERLRSCDVISRPVTYASLPNCSRGSFCGTLSIVRKVWPHHFFFFFFVPIFFFFFWSIIC